MIPSNILNFGTLGLRVDFFPPLKKTAFENLSFSRVRILTGGAGRQYKITQAVQVCSFIASAMTVFLNVII